jgi:ABC-type transport system involved in multi-copper enzyme maturation permease subunit
MIATLAWKEYREHRAVWLALGLIALALPSVVLWLAEPHLRAYRDGGHKHLAQSVAPGVAFIMALVYGVICGAMMLAGERENRTLPFLDALAPRRDPVWYTKLTTGLLLTASQAALVTVGLAVLVLSVGGAPTELLEWLGAGLAFLICLAALFVVGLIGLAWGMLFSALCSSVLLAFVLGITVLAQFGILAAFADYSVAAGGVAFVTLQVPFAFISLYASRRIFCRADRGRLPVPTEAPESTDQARSGPGWWCSCGCAGASSAACS